MRGTFRAALDSHYSRFEQSVRTPQPPRRAGREVQRRGQSSSDLDFLVFLTGFLESSGLMLIGLPALTGVAAASESLKKTRQGGLSCDLFWIMQTVMRSTSGTNAPQMRIASPLQACSCSGV